VDRPPPPLLTSLDVEEIWMSPTESTHKVLWDSTMCVDNSQGSEVRTLMKKARDNLSSPAFRLPFSTREPCHVACHYPLHIRPRANKGKGAVRVGGWEELRRTPGTIVSAASKRNNTTRP
jgi:hypothetical protein